MRKDRKSLYIQVILGVVGTTGLIALAVTAPNAVQILAPLLKKKSRQQKYYADRVLNRLIERGDIELFKKNGVPTLRLTAKGKSRLSVYRAKGSESFSTKTAKKWDGKWRIVAFDIKEHKRSVRDQIRRELTAFGLVCLQRSMWVFPYDCAELIKLLKADYKIGKELLYMRVDLLEKDAWLRRYFNLQDK